MARKKRSPAAQEHYVGPIETVDDSWKRDVLSAIDGKLTQKELAEKIPISEGGLSQALKPIADGGRKQIRFKGRIEELLGWDSKVRLKRFLDLHRHQLLQLQADELETVARVVESLVKKR